MTKRRSGGVVLCGGGTGGHVYPGLALAEALRAAGQDDLRWIGDPQRIEAKLVPAAGIPLLPWGLSRPRPRDPRWIVRSLRQAWGCWRELRRRPPQVIVALGGYAALLPGLLAPLLGRPLVVCEQNARAGRTNRLLARFARVVVTAFPEVRRDLPAAKVRQLGNPVRDFAVDDRGADPDLRILVMGGSLSARSLNDLLIVAAPKLAALAGIKLIHLAGVDDRERVAAAYDAAGLDAEVLGYCDDMIGLYRRVDLMIGRAGATSVAECCAAGLGALYIPLPWAADDHQTSNARAVARVGGGAVLAQGALRASGLVRLVRHLAADRAAVAQLGRNARRLARPAAAADTVALIRALVCGRERR
ncbi:MAG: UDP-N-acetylglucosamine--N-acetylmuramyl-(pentapeptide) pyrophosphoryl-undecaprenol N-acetylglucosamine transferase [Planctomycetota bacterium]